MIYCKNLQKKNRNLFLIINFIIQKRKNKNKNINHKNMINKNQNKINSNKIILSHDRVIYLFLKNKFNLKKILIMIIIKIVLIEKFFKNSKTNILKD